jgi:2-polyprenyl-3-methyl-5-hydroxy-6-metoxy-1,4-benzoquinol methylase
MNNCRICYSSNVKLLMLNEFLYSTGDTFEYLHCQGCNSISIKEFPSDLSKYYPQDYYSYKNSKAHSFSWKSFLRTRFVLMNALIFKKKNFFFGNIDIPDYLFQISGLTPNSKILDIGSGNGQLLYSLHNNGFTKLTGLDPFIKETIFDHGIRIIKGDINEVEEKYDLVILNHVFEHLENPIQLLNILPKLLNRNGKIILRTPLVNKAFEIYKLNWIQLDPPRHLHIFAPDILETLINKAGLKVKKVIHDSTSFQFWGSEQNIKGIGLFSSKESLAISPKSGIFPKRQLEMWENKAKEFNARNKGDQAIFIITL